MAMTKGVLMVTIGVGGLVITVIAAIVLFIVTRKQELKAKNEGNQLNKASSNSGSTQINTKGSGTNILPDSGTDTELLVSEQSAIGTEFLDQQGTEIIN